MKSILINFILISIAIVSTNANKLFNKCNCRPTVQSRILNGTKSVHIPWIAHIKWRNQLICTGFLLNEDLIVTSANCVYNKNPEDISIIVGTSDLKTTSPLHNFSVTKVSNSPCFNPYDLGMGCEVALLRLKHSVALEEGKIELACIDFDEFESNDQTMMAVGLGMIEEQKLVYSNELRYAYFKENPNLTTSVHFIKAKAVVANKTICHGDYGTPLMIQKNGRTKIVGIASFSDFENDKYCSDKIWFYMMFQTRKFIKDSANGRYCH